MYGYRILTDIQYVIPSLTLAALQGKPRFRNIVGPHSLGFGLRIVGMGQTKGIDRITRKRLRRFCPIDKNRLHAEERQRSTGHEFGFLISVHEGRELILRLALYARGQYVLQHIGQFDANRLFAHILQFCTAHPAVFAGRSPVIGELQSQGTILFAELNLVAVGSFRDRSTNLIYRLLHIRERNPEAFSFFL